MPDFTHLPLFIIASAVLLITPGPAVLYIIGRSVDQGRRAGLVSVGAIEVGNSMHVIAATLGLSALLLSSALAFSVVKYMGAAYLVYLGLRKLLACEAAHVTRARRPANLRRVFTQGVMVAMLNPKTALFFVAFLPQFIDPAQGAIAGQMLFLGGLFIAMALISDSLYLLLAGAVGHWFKGLGPVLRMQRYLVGGLYIGLGLTAAFTDVRRH